jgi:hypothetical protein
MVYALLFLPKFISKRLVISTYQARSYSNLPNNITRKLIGASLCIDSLSLKFTPIPDVEMAMEELWHHHLQLQLIALLSPTDGSKHRVIKKSMCTWWLQYKNTQKLIIWRWPSQSTFGMWTVLYWTRSSRTQFGVSINVWRLAGDTLNVTCNFLCCNHQVHRDFLITLYFVSLQFYPSQTYLPLCKTVSQLNPESTLLASISITLLSSSDSLSCRPISPPATTMPYSFTEARYQRLFLHHH